MEDEYLRNMSVFWLINGGILLLVAIQLNLGFCGCLNVEGFALLKFKERVVNDPFGALRSWGSSIGETDPCPWPGIQCVNGHVVSLSLGNLCLEGTLAPELQLLLHIQSIVLRNNSFSGRIPFDVGNLNKLELLDLSYNNIRRPLPNELGFNVSVLLLDNNGLSCNLSPDPEKDVMFSEARGDEVHLTGSVDLLPDTRQNGRKIRAKHDRMLAAKVADTPTRTFGLLNGSSNSSAAKIVGADTPPPGLRRAKDSSSPKPSPLRGHSQPSPFNQVDVPPENPDSPSTFPSPHQISPPDSSSTSNKVPSPPQTSPAGPPSQNKVVRIVVGAAGGITVLVLAIGLCFYSGNLIRKSGSWPKGLSGQLQKALVSGVQNLKRSELEDACEDFSNVIGTCSIGSIYKGTLSNGVEIAVINLAASSPEDWPKSLETQFRKKIETLSKVNHKNFVSLIGYCEEAEPFTRMLVFEYAPNGSLFEHLHVKEAEHLDWGMRLRLAMGMAYCLEHMHQLTPPVTHPNLNASSVHLSDDYAAKISDFSFWNEVAAAQVQPVSVTNLRASSATPASNVYSFGLVLLEMVTGRIPHTVDNNHSVEDWVSKYIGGEYSLQELVDPMLRGYRHEQLDKISDLIRECLHSDPHLRPTMTDITAKLKDITSIDPDKAGPRLSPLWWAELEGRPMSGGET